LRIALWAGQKLLVTPGQQGQSHEPNAAKPEPKQQIAPKTGSVTGHDFTRAETIPKSTGL